MVQPSAPVTSVSFRRRVGAVLPPASLRRPKMNGMPLRTERHLPPGSPAERPCRHRFALNAGGARLAMTSELRVGTPELRALLVSTSRDRAAFVLDYFLWRVGQHEERQQRKARLFLATPRKRGLGSSCWLPGTATWLRPSSGKAGRKRSWRAAAGGAGRPSSPSGAEALVRPGKP